MKILWNLVAFCLLPIPRSIRSEEIVVFLVGFGGWGEKELFGVPYFGFDNRLDILMPRVQLNYPHEVEHRTGLRTFVPPLGPFSSMHDRACELYAAINGERTDFGFWHARQYGHTRYGRDFSSTGSYFRNGALGDIGEDNKTNTVILVAHSFGGNTARQFERFLHEGLPSEVQSPYPEGEARPSKLFGVEARSSKDHGPWIKAIMTLATPFDGSALHSRLGAGLPNALKNILFTIISLVNDDEENLIYDADLDHFGLGRLAGETSVEMLRRIFDQPFFDPNFRDSMEYDLSPRAQYEFNANGPRSYPGTYYLAYSTYQTDLTVTSSCKGRAGAGFDAVVNSDTEFIMQPTASLLGDLTDAQVVGHNECLDEAIYKACDPNLPVSGPWNDLGYVGWCADNSWEQNDGMVSRRASLGPTFGCQWDGRRPKALGMIYRPEAGCYSWESLSDNQWYFVDIGVDHSQVIGWRTEFTLENVNNVYLLDIPSHINRIQTKGDNESWTCCLGSWCRQSAFDPPSHYHSGVRLISSRPSSTPTSSPSSALGSINPSGSPSSSQFYSASSGPSSTPSSPPSDAGRPETSSDMQSSSTRCERGVGAIWIIWCFVVL